jgi:hypothetical protein
MNDGNEKTVVKVAIDGAVQDAKPDELLIDVISRNGSKGLFQAIPEGIAQAAAEREKPVGLWHILRRACSKDGLRAMAAAMDFLEAFGRHLHSLQGTGK